jgi:hypothetical protein
LRLGTAQPQLPALDAKSAHSKPELPGRACALHRPRSISSPRLCGELADSRNTVSSSQLPVEIRRTNTGKRLASLELQAALPQAKVTSRAGKPSLPRGVSTKQLPGRPISRLK